MCCPAPPPLVARARTAQHRIWCAACDAGAGGNLQAPAKVRTKGGKQHACWRVPRARSIKASGRGRIMNTMCSKHQDRRHTTAAARTAGAGAKQLAAARVTRKRHTLHTCTHARASCEPGTHGYDMAPHAARRHMPRQALSATLQRRRSKDRPGRTAGQQQLHPSTQAAARGAAGVSWLARQTLDPFLTLSYMRRPRCHVRTRG